MLKGRQLSPEALSWPGPASSPRPLVGVGLTDGVDLQSVHTDPRVVDLELAVAAVHHEDDTVH